MHSFFYLTVDFIDEWGLDIGRQTLDVGKIYLKFSFIPSNVQRPTSDV